MDPLAPPKKHAPALRLLAEQIRKREGDDSSLYLLSQMFCMQDEHVTHEIDAINDVLFGIHNHPDPVAAAGLIAELEGAKKMLARHLEKSGEREDERRDALNKVKVAVLITIAIGLSGIVLNALGLGGII